MSTQTAASIAATALAYVTRYGHTDPDVIATATLDERALAVVTFTATSYAGDTYTLTCAIDQDGDTFAAPAGTPAQIEGKLVAILALAAEDDRIRPRVTELVHNGNEDQLVAIDTPRAHVNDVVYVHAMGQYRRGIVTKVAKTRATVAYTTASSDGRVYRKATADLYTPR